MSLLKKKLKTPKSQKVARNLTDECVSLFDQHKPEECCLLTYFKTDKRQHSACTTKCKDDDKCAYDCILESMGVYIDGKIIDSKIIEAFEKSLNESMSEEKEMFKPVFEASLEKCKILSITSF